MPYKRVGKKIYVLRSQPGRGSSWVLKQTCKSIESAKAALRLLRSKGGHIDWSCMLVGTGVYIALICAAFAGTWLYHWLMG